MGRTDPFDDRWGQCPQCGSNDGYANVGPEHWFVCERHRTAWCPGRNLFSSWRHEMPEEWTATAERLETFTVIDPPYYPNEGE